MLLRNLPREAATVQAVGGEKARWGEQEHLLASVVDAVSFGHVLLTQINTPKKARHRIPEFKPMKRPGVAEAAKGDLRGSTLPLDEMIELQRRWAAGGLHGEH